MFLLSPVGKLLLTTGKGAFNQRLIGDPPSHLEQTDGTQGTPNLDAGLAQL